MARINIPEAELKSLFAKSKNQCAFPGCSTPIIIEIEDEKKPLAEMAHMIAYSENGPRSDPTKTKEELNQADNLILLCPTHHKIIDKFPFQFSIEVLKEMKRQHEKEEINHIGVSETLIDERLYFSFLPIARLPKYVFSAATKYRKSDVLDLFDVIDAKQHPDVIYSFELKDKHIYTFYDLRDDHNPFLGTYDKESIRVLRYSDFLQKSDLKKLYIALLNRALTSFLKKKGVIFDREHYRYYFEKSRDVERKFIYKTLSGNKSTRKLVWNPITIKTSQPKRYWVHLAASLTFQQVANYQWVLTIRPERHLTKDGIQKYDSRFVGRKITKMKSTVYNWQYLQELQLWREFLSEASPRVNIEFGSQSVSIENKLAEGYVHWPGVIEDTKAFSARDHEEDLFSLADLEQFKKSSNSLDIDDSLFLYNDFEDKNE